MTNPIASLLMLSLTLQVQAVPPEIDRPGPRPTRAGIERLPSRHPQGPQDAPSPFGECTGRAIGAGFVVALGVGLGVKFLGFTVRYFFDWLGQGDVSRENRASIIGGLAAGTSIGLLAYADCETAGQR